MSEEKCIFPVTKTPIMAPLHSKSSVCTKEVQINLDKDIVRNYLIFRNPSTNNATKKSMKQMTVTHYFKTNKVLDTCSSNQTETASVGKRQSPVTKQSNNSFPPKDTQSSFNKKNKENFYRAIKTEPMEMRSPNKVFMHERCDDDMDIGEEFKYSSFLSRSINPQVDLPNTQTTQKTSACDKTLLSEKRSHGQMKTFQCDHCGLIALQKEFLRNHIKSKHSELHDESGFITCLKCCKKFTVTHAFVAHERYCGTRFYYPCKFCPKKICGLTIERHLNSLHAKDFDKKSLKEILQWSKSKRTRKAAPIRKKMNINKELFYNNAEFKKLVKIFCPTCNVSLEINEQKTMAQCRKCKTVLKLQCHKCKKTYSNAASVMKHVKQLCEYKENNVEVETNKEVSAIIEDQQTNNDIKFPQKQKMKQQEIISTDKTILSENLDVDDDINVGKEFKYSEYLSTSENAKMNAKNTVQQPIRKPFRCDYCGHRTQQKAWMRSHIKHKHSQLCDENGIFSCTKCDKKYKTLAKFNFHKCICGTRLYLPCKICSKVFTPPCELKRHVFSQHEKEFDAEKYNEILQWGKSNAVRKAANQAKSINARLPTKKLFRSYFDLNKLIKMFCSKCNVTSERELGKTKIQCLKCDTALVFQCHMCKKTYDKKASILAHVRWYCKKKDGTSDMDINKTDSDGVIKKQRSKNLYHAPILKECFPHKKTVKYFYCNDCDYEADKKPNLLNHIRFHHIEGRNKKGLFVCPKCRKKFKFSRNCKAHQLVCSASFDYKCTFCKFTAKETSHVKRHLKSVHADKIKGENFSQIINEVLKQRKNNKEKYEAAHTSTKNID